MSIVSLTPGTTDIRQIVFGVNQALERLQNFNPTPLGNSTQKGLNIVQTGPTSGTVGSNNFFYNGITVNADALNAATGNVDIAAFWTTLHTGGTNDGGSKIAAVFELIHDTASSASTAKGDHIGAEFICLASVNDGGTGTDTAGHAVGTLFACNPFVLAQAGATDYFVVSGGEVDVEILTGASARHRLGWSVVDGGNVQGDIANGGLDAAFEVAATGPGWNTGLIFSKLHGAAPVTTAGTLIGTDGNAATVTNGIDFSPYTITGDFLKGPNGFAVTGAGNMVTSAWTPFTPTVTAGTGTITTYTSTGRYQVIGKTVAFSMTIGITTNGSGATSVNTTLPVNPLSNTVCFGRENAIGGKMLQGFISSGTALAAIFNYDNTYPGSNGASLVMSGAYESA